MRKSLGGGNSKIFYVHPDPWGFMIQFDDHILHDRVVSTTNQIMSSITTYHSYPSSCPFWGLRTPTSLPTSNFLLPLAGYSKIQRETNWHQDVGLRSRPRSPRMWSSSPGWHDMGVSLNGGTPNLHPKMIIFSRKTNGCWVPPFLETPTCFRLWTFNIFICDCCWVGG